MSHIKPPLAPKTKRRTARHSSPDPSCRAVRLNFFEIADQQIVPTEARKRKKPSAASPHFIQAKSYSGFSAKKVRTSTKNVS
jgi:hypothetical protein